MSRKIFIALALSFSLEASAADSIAAIRRTNAENYKDRALASCIAAAYKDSPARDDAELTKSAFLEWAYYDDDKGNSATDQLVEKYLKRDYRNPVGAYAGAEFALLKCLDMYHSRELDEQVRKYVPRPDWIGDQAPTRKRK